MGCSVFGVADHAGRGSFSVFFPKTSPGPRSGRAGATACRASLLGRPSGAISPAKDDAAGIASQAVERQRQRCGRSARRVSFPSRFHQIPSPLGGSGELAAGVARAADMGTSGAILSTSGLLPPICRSHADRLPPVLANPDVGWCQVERGTYEEIHPKGSHHQRVA